jgi:hypothetical protein
MSHQVLKAKHKEPQNVFDHLLNSAEITWQSITRNISIGSKKSAGEFRIPESAFQNRGSSSTHTAKGVGYVYKKIGSTGRR